MAKSTKQKKFLIETSAVRPALNQSTAKHHEHFTSATADGDLWTSTYIRMEFIRLWVCSCAIVACAIRQFTDTSEALIYLEQDFKIRKLKSYISIIANYLRSTGAIQNTIAAAEEVASLGVNWLKQFDDLFPSRINNACHCEIGGDTPTIDFDSVVEDLQQFYLAFTTPVEDCKVNAFLQLQHPHGRVQKLLSDAKIEKLNVGKNLIKLRQKNAWITCNECSWIGDAVIALEQPASVDLVHSDHSFNDLCRVRGREHTEIMSVRGLHGKLELPVARPEE